MEFGDFEPLRRPTANVSSDALVYRGTTIDDVEILVATRQNEPWKGCVTGPFGGYIDPDDINPTTAAVRELTEETGLTAEVRFLIGIYGPERYHYTPTIDERFVGALVTSQPAHVRPVVAFVFAAQVTGGVLGDTAEQKGMRWVRPDDLVGVDFAFDHARAITHFLMALSDTKRRRLAEAVLSFIH